MAKKRATKKKGAADPFPWIAADLRALAVPIEDVKPATRNPVKHDDANVDAVARSLQRYGQYVPLLANRRNGEIVIGNARLAAAVLLEWSHVAVIWRDLSDAEAARLAINDNRLPELSEWDEAADVAYFEDVADWEASLLLDELRADEPEEDAAENPEAQLQRAEELRREWGTEVGQLWTAGDHRLVCGDASDAATIERALDGREVDALATDPPYSSGGQFRSDRGQDAAKKYVHGEGKKTRASFGGDNRDQRAFVTWATIWLGTAFRLSRRGAVALVFTDWRQLPTVTDAVQSGGWVWRNLVTWWKPGCRMQRGRFSLSAEYIVFASHGVPTPGEASPPNVLAYPSPRGSEHIAEKPLDLMRELLGVTTPGAVVLDPFAGSGTTLIAAAQLGRVGIGVELSPEYVAIILDRLRAVGLSPELAK
jgi:site-specific DNA-methyltransferase (adenine-specific)